MKQASLFRKSLPLLESTPPQTKIMTIFIFFQQNSMVLNLCVVHARWVALLQAWSALGIDWWTLLCSKTISMLEGWWLRQDIFIIRFKRRRRPMLLCPCYLHPWCICHRAASLVPCGLINIQATRDSIPCRPCRRFHPLACLNTLQPWPPALVLQPIIDLAVPHN